MDISLDYEDLKDLRDRLDAIITEFDEAKDRADKVEDAIGDPFGKNDLREAVEDFEDRWNNKRDDLRDDLKTVLENIDLVVKEFKKLDKEAAKSFELDLDRSAPAPARRGGPTA